MSINSDKKNLLEKKPIEIIPNKNLDKLEPIAKTSQEDNQKTKDPTIFGDWQINCRTIDF